MSLAIGFPLIVSETPFATEEADFRKAVSFLLCLLETTVHMLPVVRIEAGLSQVRF
jgi:hypothetical protein